MSGTERFPAEKQYAQQLEKRNSDNSLRSLIFSGLIDFSSNDYLGFSRSAELKQKIFEFDRQNNLPLGSTGSRLLTGNSPLAMQLEEELAAFLKGERALLFNSGYDANIGIFSALCRKDDLVLYDEYCHASVHDGLRMSFAGSFKFRHNDTEHLEEKIKQHAGKNIFVAVESVYSMNGDFAPLAEIAALCSRYGAQLIVDEAHASGVFGPEGQGRCVELGIEQSVFLRMHTFGKALGVTGAGVICSAITKEYLVNYCRPFIYTTALPYHSLAAIKCAIEYLRLNTNIRDSLMSRIRLFKSVLSHALPGDSPIQAVLVKGNSEVKRASEQLRQAGFDVRPILSPTVPAGMERLRICLHAFNTDEEVKNLSAVLNEILNMSFKNFKNELI